jgi:hypothetical protein
MRKGIEAGTFMQTEYADATTRAFTESERNAMRSYLQRTEVRLSTLHRVGVAFISGAGLLVLLPVFFKEEIVVLIRIFLDHTMDFASQLNGSQGVVILVLYACLIYPFVLSLGIPVYAMYLMLKDVIHFYFTIYTPGFPSDLHTPSFALSAVGFSPDESPEAKAQILQYQYLHTGAVNFAIPFSAEKRKAYFDETIRSTQGEIIPESRRWEVLKEALPAETDRETVDRFGAAFGLARLLDRQLIEEVAVSELSLVRHIIYLRRLVVRYMKTLLMFIWTTIVTFLMLAFLQDERMPLFLVMAVGYLVWSLLVMRVMQMPLGWLYRHLRGIPDEHHIDRQLVIMETQVRWFCRAAVFTSVLALVLSIWLYFV